MKSKEQKRKEACERINATIKYRIARIAELKLEAQKKLPEVFAIITSLISIHERKLKINQQHYTNTRNKLTTFMEIN